MALDTKRNIIGKAVPNAVPKSQKKEKEREDNAWKKKLFGYLEGFKKSFSALEGGKERKKSGLGGLLKMFGGSLKGLMGMILGSLGLTGIFAKVSGLGIAGAALFPAAIIFWGITSAFNIIQDFMAGFKEGGLSGGIAKALGGAEKGGIWNSIVQASKWGGIGALAGLATFGPVGALIGGLLGLALGAIFGWLGSERIQTWIDKIFGLPEGQLLTEAELAQVEKDKAAMTANIAATTAELTAIQAEMKAIEDAVAARGFMYDSERIALDKLIAEEAAAILKLGEERKARAALNTKTQEHHLAVTQESQAQVDEQIEATGETWTNLENNIIALKEELIALEKIGGLTDAERKFRLDQIAALEAQVVIQQDIKNKLRDEEKELEKKAQEIQRDLAYEKSFGAGLWVDTKLFFKNLWQGTFLPRWMSQPVNEWLPLWMRQPLAITLQHDLPEGIGNLWKAIGNFWQGKDSEGNPLFDLPEWMTQPMGDVLGELFSDLGKTFLSRVWNPFTGWIKDLYRKVGNWLFIPKGQHPDHPSPAILFGVKLEWPEWMKNAGVAISNRWNASLKWLAELPSKIGAWIYTPAGAEGAGGRYPSPAKLFGVSLVWPEWMKEAGLKMSAGWNKAMAWLASLPAKIGAWIYTPGGRETGPPGTGAITGATIFGVQLPTLPALGSAIDEAWNKLTTWVKNLGLWFWNKPAGTMFGNFQIPTLSIPDIEWEAIVQGLMGKVASMIGKIPFIDRVPGMSGFLSKWGVDDRPSGPTQADVMPPVEKIDAATGISAGGQAQLQTHEGFRGTAYDDTEGVRTIGYGFNLDRTYAKTRFQDSLPGLSFADVKSGKVSITEDQAKKLMLRDLKDARKDAARFVGQDVFTSLDQKMKDVLVNMAYNLGGSRLGKFTDLQAALTKDTGPDYKAASEAMLDSKWAEQVKGRATDLAAIAEAIGHSKAHMRTDLGLLMEANKGILPVKLVGDVFKPIPPKVSGDLLSAFAQQRASGGTTVNNVTVAPTTSNSSSNTTIAENTYGVADPYTSASGAYG